MDNSFKFNILWQNETHDNQIYNSVLFKEFEIIFHGKKQQVLNTKVRPTRYRLKTVKKPYRFKVISIISNR